MKALKGWDAYVAEASQQLLLPLPGGDQITVTIPTKARIRKFNEAMAASDDTAMITALLGDADAEKVFRLLDDAPEGTAAAMMMDVLREFGLLRGTPDTGNTSDSTTAHAASLLDPAEQAGEAGESPAPTT